MYQVGTLYDQAEKLRASAFAKYHHRLVGRQDDVPGWDALRPGREAARVGVRQVPPSARGAARRCTRLGRSTTRQRSCARRRSPSTTIGSWGGKTMYQVGTLYDQAEKLRASAF